MKTKQYIIGEYSRLFFDALDTFQAFKEDFFNALQRLYGEETGEKYFHQYAEHYDALERAVMDYVRYNAVLEMGTGKDTITI